MASNYDTNLPEGVFESDIEFGQSEDTALCNLCLESHPEDSVKHSSLLCLDVCAGCAKLVYDELRAKFGFKEQDNDTV